MKYYKSTYFWTFICLLVIYVHSFLAVMMMVRLPALNTHWIIFGINLFNMISSHVFTSFVASNIIFNLLFDKEFYTECLIEGKLRFIMRRLFS